MRPVSDPPIQLGIAHCCACKTEAGEACYHVGPVQLCDRHGQPAAVRPLRTEDEVRVDALPFIARKEADDGR